MPSPAIPDPRVAPEPAQVPFSIRPLVLVVALCSIAFMAFNTVIGPIARVTGMVEWQIGAMVSLAGLCWMLSSRPWGRRADRIGRLPVLRSGMLGFTGVFGVLALVLGLGLQGVLAGSALFVTVLIVRALLGGFYGAVPVSSQAIVADAFAPAQRAGGMATLAAGNGVGMVLGPAMAAGLGGVSLIAPIVMAVLLGVVALVLTRRLQTPSVPTTRAPGRPVAPMSLTDRRLRWPMAVGLCAMYCVMSAQVNTAFFVMDRFVVPAAQATGLTGAMLTAVGLAMIAAQLLVRRLTAPLGHDWSPTRLIATGAAIASLGFLATSVSPLVWVLGCAYFMSGFGMGMVLPAISAAAANAVSAHEQGAAAGTVSTAQAGGMVVAPMVSTLLYHLRPELPFWAAAGVLALLAGFALRRLALRGRSAARADARDPGPDGGGR
ncbi:MAG: MFS transporter [Burkholderiaceae bacterium]|nr:MFS transporter [Burkholderiaceae bacterium]